jgi:hypothetical protein
MQTVRPVGRQRKSIRMAGFAFDNRPSMSLQLDGRDIVIGTAIGYRPFRMGTAMASFARYTPMADTVSI